MSYKRIFIIIITVLLFSSISYADITSLSSNEIIDNKVIDVKGFTLEVKTNEDIQWEQKENSFTPIYKNDSKYIIILDTRTGEINKSLKPISNITFSVNKLEETDCTYSFYLTECLTKKWDFTKFESKNIITRKDIIPIYQDKGIIEDIKDLIGIGTGDVIIGYDINYYGTIKDLDPMFVETYSTSTIGFFNRTEATTSGIRTVASFLMLDFNENATVDVEGFFTTVNDKSIYNHGVKLN